jgi:hypothetical protein
VERWTVKVLPALFIGLIALPGFVRAAPLSTRVTTDTSAAAGESVAHGQPTPTVIGKVQCPPPSISDAAIELSAEPGSAFLNARYATTQACHGHSQLTLQLRDAAGAIVFNRALDASPTPETIAIHWPIDVQPGASFELQATILYGAERAQKVTGRRRLTVGCPPPSILDFGYAQSEGTALGAHLQIAACNIPVTAKLMIRDPTGRTVAALERVIRQPTDGAIAPLALGSIRHLKSGRFGASLVVTDSRGQAATRESSIERDVDSPTVRFLVAGQEVSPGSIPTLQGLAELVIDVEDGQGLLAPARLLAAQPPALEGAEPRARLRDTVAGDSPELRFVAEYDVPRAANPSQPTGVLVTATDGRLWLVPAVRRFLLVEPNELRDADPTREVAGLTAYAEASSLVAGTYRVVGVVLERDGRDELVPSHHEFTVSTSAHRRASAVLRQGATEVPLQFARQADGRVTLAADRPVPEGTYSLQIEPRDRFGNTPGPTIQILRIGRSAGTSDARAATREAQAPPNAAPATAAPPGLTPVALAPMRTPLRLTTIGSQLVLPKPLSLDLRFETPEGDFDPAVHGSIAVADVSVTRRSSRRSQPLAVTARVSRDGRLHVELPALTPGTYDLRLAARLTRAAADAAPGAAVPATPYESSFTVLDGRPISGQVLALRDRGVAPLTGHLSVELTDPARRSDVARVTWERSLDGQRYEPEAHDAEGFDFAIGEPGVRFYRARLVNRHTGAESVTPEVRLSAVPAERLTIDGPDQTFSGYPIELRASGVPEDRVLWRVISPGERVPEEHRGATLRIEATLTGTVFVEAVALDALGDADAPAAPRVFRAIEIHWPSLPPAVIVGPSQVERGRSTTFTIVQPAMFQSRGNPAIQRIGEWELPDGRRVSGQDFVEVTLDPKTQGDEVVSLFYHSWIDGARDETIKSAVHRIRQYEYRWPQWTLDTLTTSLTLPSIYRLALRPATWQAWLDLPDVVLQTNWHIPPQARVLHRTDRELIVELQRPEPFDVVVTVADDRGHSAELAARGVSPVRRTPLEIQARLVADRALHTAPLKVTVSVEPIVAPPERRIARVAYYLNGAFAGATDGSPLSLQLVKPGQHRIRTIASIGTDIVAEDTIVFDVADNAPALCRIEVVGDLALNGVAKAECDDPDGQVVEYRWYRNGQLFDTSGPRVRLNGFQLQGLKELSLVAVDNAGKEASARLIPEGAT